MYKLYLLWKVLYIFKQLKITLVIYSLGGVDSTSSSECMNETVTLEGMLWSYQSNDN